MRDVFTNAFNFSMIHPVELTNLKYTFLKAFIMSVWYFIMHFVKGKILRVFSVKFSLKLLTKRPGDAVKQPKLVAQ
jgi:hypothetical protein